MTKLLSQPFSAIFTGCLAGLVLASAWYAYVGVPTQLDPGALLLGLGLMGGVVLAYHYPIHLHYRLKVELTTVPLYLMAVLLPLPLAATCAGAAVFLAECTVQSQRGSLWVDRVTQTARLILVVLTAGVLYHQLDGYLSWIIAPLTGSAFAMFALDTITLPFLLVPISGESARSVIGVYATKAASTEMVQYVVSIIGVLAMRQEPLSLIALLVPAALTYRASKTALELQMGTREMLENLADTVDLRDPYTGGHSRRVTEFCAGIMRELPLAGPDAELILTAARVHDIGKIAIPDGILNKPGPLTAEERAIMESHSALGADFLQRYSNFARGEAIVRHHHESWDGKGYPAGLKGTDIPLGARIIAVADSFDAMTSDRPYRSGMSVERAVQILRSGAGQQWDSSVVMAFLSSIGQQPESVTRPATVETVPSRQAGQNSALPSGIPATGQIAS